MDTFHCVKKSPPLVNETEKVQKNGTILQRNYCVYKKDWRALM